MGRGRGEHATRDSRFGPIGLALMLVAVVSLGPPAALGSDTVLESPHAALYLRDSSIKGNGPDKPNVDFKTSLAFRPPTRGWTYAVER